MLRVWHLSNLLYPYATSNPPSPEKLFSDSLVFSTHSLCLPGPLDRRSLHRYFNRSLCGWSSCKLLRTHPPELESGRRAQRPESRIHDNSIWARSCGAARGIGQLVSSGYGKFWSGCSRHVSFTSPYWTIFLQITYDSRADSCCSSRYS